MEQSPLTTGAKVQAKLYYVFRIFLWAVVKCKGLWRCARVSVCVSACVHACSLEKQSYLIWFLFQLEDAVTQLEKTFEITKDDARQLILVRVPCSQRWMLVYMAGRLFPV